MLVNISICGSSVGQLKIIFIIYLAHIKGINEKFIYISMINYFITFSVLVYWE